MKLFIRKWIQKTGWDLHRISPSTDPVMQLRRTLDWIGINLVLDVGANVGQFACGLRRVGFDGEIVSFEPLSSARPMLLKNAKGDSKWIVHERCAIGDQSALLFQIAANANHGLGVKIGLFSQISRSYVRWLTAFLVRLPVRLFFKRN